MQTGILSAVSGKGTSLISESCPQQRKHITPMKSTLFLLSVLSAAPAVAATSFFDVDSDSAGSTNTQANYLSIDGVGSSTDSASGYTVTLGGALVGDDRDRGVATTSSGFIQVPDDTFGALYRDFVFARGSAPITVGLTGLEANTVFRISIFSYDGGATNGADTADAVQQTVTLGGSVVGTLNYTGDQGDPQGTEPDTSTNNDNRIDFTATSDASGAISFTTESAADQGARLNGIIIESVPEPSSALLSLIGLATLARRHRS